jgi:hypothetical protein
LISSSDFDSFVENKPSKFDLLYKFSRFTMKKLSSYQPKEPSSYQETLRVHHTPQTTSKAVKEDEWNPQVSIMVDEDYTSPYHIKELLLVYKTELAIAKGIEENTSECL